MAAAVTDAYATVAEYKAVIPRADSSGDKAIEDGLVACSRLIDGELKRFFTKDATPVARLYDPKRSGRSLYIDDVATLTGLVIKLDQDRDRIYETTLLATDYEMWPLNANKGPEPKPWDEIVLTYNSTAPYFTCGIRVQVTAAFGWPSVPQAIKQACIQLTGILRLESVRARREMVAADMMLTTSREAQDIVSDLKNLYPRYFFG